jgi:hypothetical protein
MSLLPLVHYRNLHIGSVVNIKPFLILLLYILYIFDALISHGCTCFYLLHSPGVIGILGVNQGMKVYEISKFDGESICFIY